jgi:hypothetical protein
MIPNPVKAQVLRDVVNGKSIKQAAVDAGLSQYSANNALFRMCRMLELSHRIENIRAEPQRYLDALDEREQMPDFSLAHRLGVALHLRSDTELTPQYLSNITASQLLDRGFTLVAIDELQRWLGGRGFALKRSPPQTAHEIRAVERAITVLEVFHFDTTVVRQQLRHLLGDDEEVIEVIEVPEDLPT